MIIRLKQQSEKARWVKQKVSRSASLNLFTNAGTVTSWVVLVGFIFWLSIALFDLSDGRFQLFMDEQISFDGTTAVYYSESPSELLRNLAYGFDGDLRYGRAFWNFLAALSFPAYLIAGEPGLIVSNRIVGLLLLVGAYGILAKTVGIRGPLLPLTVGALLLLPTTLHYVAMPKPEPLMLLVLAMAFWRFVKNDFNLTPFAAILLGFAFGLKVSAAPLVAMVGVVALVRFQLTKPTPQSWVSFLSQMVFWGLTGWVVCSPIMLLGLWPIMFLMLGLNLVAGARDGDLLAPYSTTFLSLNRRRSLLIFSVLSLVLIAAYRLIGSESPSGWAILSRWWEWNSGQARLGGVSLSSVMAWFQQSADTFFAGSMIVLLFQAGLGILIAAIFARKNSVFRNIEPHTIWQSSNETAAVWLVVGSVFLSGSIMLSVERTWSFYLHPGMVFWWTALIGLSIKLVSYSCRGGTSKSDKSPALRFVSPFLGFAALGIVFVMSAVHVSGAVNWWQTISSRTETVVYQQQLDDYEELRDFLRNEAQVKGRTLSVAMDPRLFQPESPDWLLHRYWGGNIPWQASPDVVVIGPTHLYILDTTDHFQDDSLTQACRKEPCYRTAETLPSGGLILAQ